MGRDFWLTWERTKQSFKLALSRSLAAWLFSRAEGIFSYFQIDFCRTEWVMSGIRLSIWTKDLCHWFNHSRRQQASSWDMLSYRTLLLYFALTKETHFKLLNLKLFCCCFKFGLSKDSSLSFCPVSYGVPQSSVLSPILFSPKKNSIFGSKAHNSIVMLMIFHLINLLYSEMFTNFTSSLKDRNHGWLLIFFHYLDEKFRFFYFKKNTTVSKLCSCFFKKDNIHHSPDTF